MESPRPVRPRVSFSEISDHSPAYYDGRKSPRSLSRRKKASSAAGSPQKSFKKSGSKKNRVVGMGSAMYLGIVALCAVVGLMWMVGRRTQGERRPRAIIPLPVPKVMNLPQFGGEHAERLFWGTYRSNLYLGIRARTPKSLLAGLMWLAPHEGRFALRHTCEHGDKLQRYGWLRHDGDRYGRQEIVDSGYTITTSFFNTGPRAVEEGQPGYGGDWAVRISAQTRDIGLGETEDERMLRSIYERLILMFYVVDEGGSQVHLWPQHGGSPPSGTVNGVFAMGTSDEYGAWELHVRVEGGSGEAPSGHFVGLSTKHVHNITDLVMQKIEAQARERRTFDLPDQIEAGANFGAYQLSGDLPLSAVDFVFVSGVGADRDATEARVRALSGDALTAELERSEREFDSRFEKTFVLGDGEGVAKVPPPMLEVAKAALSNMVGGIGYFYGQSRIAIPPHLQEKATSAERDRGYWLSWPAALYTAVPSRSFFPRGFLWDEGFHQLLISRWDANISLDTIGHWLDLVNIDGWIAREQILGDEARSKVPEEFVLQHTSNANPPTLFLPIRQLAVQLAHRGAGAEDAETEMLRGYLRLAFPRLQAWFNWFNSTQTGEVPGSYYWHGRDAKTDRELNPKTLTSGLDDFPRASHPGPEERHLDLRCWMSLASSAMASIARSLGHPSNVYEEMAARLSDMAELSSLHLTEDRGQFFDWGNHTDRVSLQRVEHIDPHTGQVQRPLVRSVKGKPKPRFVRHFGYVSLFPLLMRLIPPESATLGRQLELLTDENLLWTPYGLRSLAKTSSMYMKRNTEHDAPYWRGPVWININYLTLASLHHYAQLPGPHRDVAKDVYVRLRNNLISNIVKQYEESGYIWEQYDNVHDGHGKGTHPFTGWTSLVVLMMAELY